MTALLLVGAAYLAVCVVVTAILLHNAPERNDFD